VAALVRTRRLLESGKTHNAKDAALTAAIEYTRWGSIDMERSGAEAYAAQGVDRLVVGTTAADLNEQLRQLEAFATRHGLRR
jgi:hypothetical protein